MLLNRVPNYIYTVKGTNVTTVITTDRKEARTYRRMMKNRGFSDATMYRQALSDTVVRTS